MAQPSTRKELIEYCKRQLGSPVLEINVADEQIDDLVDDAVQLFQERHFDGTIQTYLKYEITQEDIDRGIAKKGGVGIATTSATSTTGVSFDYFENKFVDDNSLSTYDVVFGPKSSFGQFLKQMNDLHLQSRFKAILSEKSLFLLTY